MNACFLVIPILLAAFATASAASATVLVPADFHFRADKGDTDTITAGSVSGVREFTDTAGNASGATVAVRSGGLQSGRYRVVRAEVYGLGVDQAQTPGGTDLGDQLDSGRETPDDAREFVEFRFDREVQLIGLRTIGVSEKRRDRFTVTVGSDEPVVREGDHFRFPLGTWLPAGQPLRITAIASLGDDGEPDAESRFRIESLSVEMKESESGSPPATEPR